MDGRRKENYLAFQRSPNPSRISKYNKQCFLKEHSTHITPSTWPPCSERLSTLAFSCTFQVSAITVSLRALPAPGPDTAALGTPGSKFPVSLRDWVFCCLTAPVPQRYSPARV